MSFNVLFSVVNMFCKVVMVFGKFLCKLKMVHLMARDRIKTKSFTVFAEIKLRMILPFN